MLHERCTRARVTGSGYTLVDPFRTLRGAGAPARGDRGTRTVYIIRVARVRGSERVDDVCTLDHTHSSTTPLVCAVYFRRGMWKTSRAAPATLELRSCRFPSAGPARIRDPCPRGARFFHLCLDFDHGHLAPGGGHPSKVNNTFGGGCLDPSLCTTLDPKACA